MRTREAWFGELRSLLTRQTGWPALVEALEAWRHDDAYVQEVLPYCLAHTTSWPAHPAPVAWFEAWMEGKDRPLLALCDTLRLSGHDLGPVGLERVLERGPWVRLREVTLERQNLGDAGVEVLCRSAWRAEIQRVGLGSNEIGSLGAGAFVERPGGWPKLEVLELGGNQIGGEGLSMLTRYPEALPALRHLNVANCRLRDEDIEQMCQGFVPGNLKHLTLGWNPLGTVSARALASCRALEGVALTLHSTSWGPEALAILEGAEHLGDVHVSPTGLW